MVDKLLGCLGMDIGWIYQEMGKIVSGGITIDSIVVLGGMESTQSSESGAWPGTSLYLSGTESLEPLGGYNIL